MVLAYFVHLKYGKTEKLHRPGSALDSSTESSSSFDPSTGRKRQETKTKSGPVEHFMEINNSKARNSNPMQSGPGLQEMKITNSDLESSSPTQGSRTESGYGVHNRNNK